MTVALTEGVDLRGWTTLHLGGPAAAMTEASDPDQLRVALALARERDWPVLVLGGGSNLVVSDAGWDGLVIRYTDATIERTDRGDVAHLRVGAGLGWDALVARTVGAGLAGLECLSGIPGRVGAAPIQNVGAYGQEVVQTIEAVEAVERATGEGTLIPASECGFAYRDSKFKGAWRDRYVITAVRFALTIGGAPTLRYPELAKAVGEAPTLASVREHVLRIRAGKSMVLDPVDPNSRSAGSFFTNPLVAPGTLADVDMPRWPTDDGRVKLSAAWLIDHAGFAKGEVHGGAGISANHVLALIGRGGPTADLVALAATIRAGVREAYGITLVPEPVFVGFDRTVDELLG
ncbi:MAG: UDP-N-acetylmuramate dehydrogenase [Proteobacteria bacterium]|nr:UDP-N-acetylmuramate dehydrogenase [Pseudomonadota bacterium]